MDVRAALPRHVADGTQGDLLPYLNSVPNRQHDPERLAHLDSDSEPGSDAYHVVYGKCNGDGELDGHGYPESDAVPDVDGYPKLERDAVAVADSHGVTIADAEPDEHGVTVANAERDADPVAFSAHLW